MSELLSYAYILYLIHPIFGELTILDTPYRKLLTTYTLFIRLRNKELKGILVTHCQLASNCKALKECVKEK